MTTASWSGITSANWCIFSDTPRPTGAPIRARSPRSQTVATSNIEDSQFACDSH